MIQKDRAALITMLDGVEAGLELLLGIIRRYRESIR